MPAPGAAGLSVPERVSAELRTIKSEVAGVYGSVVATSDGLLVSHDVPGLEPNEIAALVATTRALANRMTMATARGQFREVVARGSDGYLAVYAAGHNAIVAVIGTSELNVGLLHCRVRAAIEQIAALSSGFTRWGASSQVSPQGAAAAESGYPAAAPSGLPVRLPARRP